MLDLPTTYLTHICASAHRESIIHQGCQRTHCRLSSRSVFSVRPLAYRSRTRQQQALRVNSAFWNPSSGTAAGCICNQVVNGVHCSHIPTLSSGANGSGPAQPVDVTVERAARNSRRLYAAVQIAAPVDVVWGALTDYQGLGNFIPGRHTPQTLETGSWQLGTAIGMLSASTWGLFLCIWRLGLACRFDREQMPVKDTYWGQAVASWRTRCGFWRQVQSQGGTKHTRAQQRHPSAIL